MEICPATKPKAIYGEPIATAFHCLNEFGGMTTFQKDEVFAASPFPG